MKKIGIYISGKSNRLFKFLTSKNALISNIGLVFSDEKIDDELENEIANCNITY